MTDQTAHPNDGFEDDVVLADGVDEEPVESNRRTFGGWRLWLVGALAFFYAAFHMAALNGLSIGNIMALPTSIQADRAEGRAADSFDALKAALGPAAEDFEGNSNRRLLALAEEAGPGLDNADEVAALADSLTTASEAANDLNAEARSVSRAWGERLFFLPTFPLETWNFRIVHIAGALALGFLLFSPRRFVDGGRAQPMAVSYGILVLAIPALIALWTVGGFFAFLGSGQGVEMGGKYIWMSLPAMVDGAPNPRLEAFSAYTGIYETEIRWFGLPLLIATIGGIIAGWVEKRERGQFAASDIVLAICGVTVAAYLIMVFSTAGRNAVGTAEVRSALPLPRRRGRR